jgi:hypothetical protein
MRPRARGVTANSVPKTHFHPYYFRHLCTTSGSDGASEIVRPDIAAGSVADTSENRNLQPPPNVDFVSGAFFCQMR